LQGVIHHGVPRTPELFYSGRQRYLVQPTVVLGVLPAAVDDAPDHLPVRQPPDLAVEDGAHLALAHLEPDREAAQARAAGLNAQQSQVVAQLPQQ
jgi:hypothetical protein